MAYLLPPSTKNNNLIASSKESFIPKNSVIAKKSIKQNQFFNEQVENVKVKVIDIEKTIGNRFKIYRKKIKVKNFLRKKEEQKEKESRLERTQKIDKNGKVKEPSLPQTGFLDGLKQYFGNILAGLFFTKIDKFMPSILAVVNVIKPIASFIADIGSKLLNGLVTFIDWGYKAYDQTRKWIGEKFGENATKKFDEFTKAFDTFITGAITLGILYSKGKGPGMREPKTNTRTTQATTPKSGFRGYEAWAKNFPQQAAKDAARQSSRINAAKLKQSRFKRFSGRVGKGNIALVLAQIFMPELQDLTSGLYGAAGFGIRKKSDKELMDEYLKLIERKRKMDSGPLGSLVSQAYDVDVEEDFLRREIERRKLSVQSKADGGTITRDGKIVGGSITRTIKKPQRKKIIRPTNIKKQQTKPGSSIGGEKRIQNLYPNPTDPTRSNPFKVLKRASTSFKKVPLIGQIGGIAIDAVLGQKPDPTIVETFGKNFGTYIENAINQQTSMAVSDVVKNIQAVAEGGLVRDNKEVTKYSKNIGYTIASSLKNSVSAQVNSIINDITKNLRLKPTIPGTVPPDGSTPPGGGPDGTTPSIVYGGPGIEGLASFIAKAETGGRWNAYNGDWRTGSKGDDAILKLKLTELRSYMTKNYPNSSGAVGAYQFMPETAIGYAKQLGLDPSKTVFSADIQKKLNIKHLRSMGYDDFVSGKLSRNDFGRRIAQQYRAVPDPYTGKTYADSASSRNAATVTLDQFNTALDDSKKKAVELVPKVKGGTLPSQIPLTSRQGWRWGKMHKGIDLDGGHKSPISTTQDATVIWAGDKGDGYGNSVILKYSNGAETRFAHFDSIKVKKDQKIKAGQLLGYQGNTGQSTASHLHFEFYPSGGAMTYEGYGDAFSVKDTYFRYGGNIEPIVPDKPLDKVTPPKTPEVGSGLNKGVYYDPKKNKFFKKGGGLLGIDQEVDPNQGTNIQFRSLPNFLGRGTKKNETKKGPDGQMYYWDGKNWQRLTDPEQLMSSTKQSGDFLVSFNLIDNAPIAALNNNASSIQEYPSYAPAGGNQVKVLIQPILSSQVG
jgi:murein DD-endopeptidase MepM/ murein hydrolase activator NlpD